MQPTHAPTQAKDQLPKPQRLNDIPVPPDLAAEIDRYCARIGAVRKWDREQVTEDIKLQYFFGGNHVAYLPTPEGLVILAVGQMDSEEFGKVLDSLSREVRCRVILYPVSRWNDSVSQILTPFSHED